MKIGIIGTGDISRAFLKSAHELKLDAVSVLSRKKATAEAFAEANGMKNAFDQINDFLATVDLVYVGLPNSLHYETAKTCLLNGKHVLLEKPLVLHYEEYEELLEIAADHEVMILEVDRVSYLPNYRRIKETINDTLRLIQVDFCKQSRRYLDYQNGELPHIFDARYGGGALYDLGVYGLHFIVGLLGEPKQINYICQKGRGGVDMTGILTLVYPTCLASITLSKISHGQSKVLLQGENFNIVSNTAPSRLIDLKISKNNQMNQYNDDIDNFTHYLKHAIEIIQKNDRFEYQRQSEKSKLVLKLLEKARKSENIKFE